MTTEIRKTFETVEAGIENMLAAAVADYVGWANKSGGKSEIRLKMDEDFKNSFTIKNGSKYIKISNESGGTWGFVVNRLKMPLPDNLTRCLIAQTFGVPPMTP